MSFLDKIFKRGEEEKEKKEQSTGKPSEKEETVEAPASETTGEQARGVAYQSVLKEPVISEKSRDMSLDGKYVFMVDVDANKKMVQQEVEDRWEVTVDSVNTMITQKRPKRIPGTRETGTGKVEKKAIVTLREGDKIDIFPA